MYTNEIFESLIISPIQSSIEGSLEKKGERVEMLYRSLKSDILCAKFEPGERLIEERLTQRYQQPSRTLIREVLARLKSEGHVSVRGRSFINPQYSPQALLQLYDVRQSLEVLAVKCCTENKNVSGLRAYLTSISKAQEKNNSIAVNAADGLFHLKIAELSGNETLLEHLARIHEKVFHIRNIFFTNEAKHTDLVEAHSVLLNAIERGVAEIAMAEMSHHLHESRQKFEKQL